MTPDLPPPATRPSLLARVQDLYDECRFLDAYALTADQWVRPPRTVVDLDVDESIMGSRLAYRLGSARFGRALMRYAEARWPDHPRVRYFSEVQDHSLLDALSRFEAKPELEGADDEMRVSWLSSWATRFALVRDFERARGLLRQAEAIDGRDWYLACHQSTCARLEERWDEALEHAERAWQQRSGHPSTADALAGALRALGRADEATERILAVASRGQSYELLLLALGLMASSAATSTEQRVQRGRQVLAAAEPLQRLAPLADPTTQRTFARVRAYAARLMGDHEQLWEHAQRSRDPVLKAIVERMRRGDVEPHRVVLDYPSIQQRHDTCVPASIATCLSALGHPVDADEISEALTYGGTSVWRANRWARERGLETRCFSIDASSARALLDAGIPFVTIFSAESHGHACAAIGLDQREGMLLLHDPADASVVECMIDEVGESLAPLGLLGVAILPPEAAARISDLLLPDEEQQTTLIAVEEALEVHEVQRVAERLPTDGALPPALEYAQALVWSQQGRNREALAAFQGLLDRFPRSRRLQGTVVHEAIRTRDSATQERVLRQILAGSPDPLHDPVSALRGAPPYFVSLYAGLLRRTAQRHREAETLLRRALRDAPLTAELYYGLAELLWDRGQREASLLPYRIASCLSPSHDGFAESYAWALLRLRRGDQAVAWLRERADRMQSSAAPAGPVMSTAELLASMGDSGSAVDLLRSARERRPEHGGLAAAAAPSFARMGYHEDAAAAREVASREATSAELAACDTQLARIEGDLEAALRHAEIWLEREPTSLPSRGIVLGLVEAHEGLEAAITRARAWVEQSPGDEGVEQLLLGYLMRARRHTERKALLLAALERDPHDAWTRRELTFLDLAQLRHQAQPDADELARLRAKVERCIADAPTDGPSLALEAELALLEGRSSDAIAELERACLLDPHYAYALRRRVELAPRQGPEGLPSLLDFLDRLVASARAFDLSEVASMLPEVAKLVGPRAVREAIGRWEALVPDDPYLLEAAIDLEIGDAARDRLEAMVQRLREVVARHPYHRGLRISLAWVFDRLDRPDAARVEYESLCEDFRGEASVRIALASFLRRRGDSAGSLAQLETAIALAPRVVGYRAAKARWLRDEGRIDEALAVLDAAARVDPRAALEPRLLTWAELGRWSEVIELCDRVADDPDVDANTLTLVAEVLGRAAGDGHRRRARELLARAMELEPDQWDVVAQYCYEMRVDGDHDEAERAARAFLTTNADPVFARGELVLVRDARGDRTAAIAELETLLEERPDYRFGWSLLTAWLEEGGRWKRLRKVLERMPEYLRGAEEYQVLRVRVLPRAGARRKEQWAAVEALVREHPLSNRVRSFAFDWYVERDAVDRAEQALLGGGGDDGVLDSPLLARKVALRTIEGRSDDAVSCMQALWRRGRPCERQDLEVALQALTDGGLLPMTLRALEADYEAAREVSMQIAEAVVNHSAQQKLLVELVRLGRALWLSSAPRATELLARVLEWLADEGLRESLEHFLDEDRQRFRDDPELWAVVGYTYLVSRRHGDAMDWLADWSERPNLPMNVLANVGTTAIVVGRYAEAIEATTRALESCRPDQGRPFAVRSLYAALLHDGRVEELRSYWARFGPVEGESARAEAIHCFMDMLRLDLPVAERERLARHFRRLRLEQEDRPLRYHWNALVRTRLSAWSRFKVLLTSPFG